MITCFIGLGSNLQDPIKQIMYAMGKIKCLPKTNFIQVSSFYKTSPIGKKDQADFLNAVAELQTNLSALTLLQQLQQIELDLGRERLERWGPRIIDLDLLLYGHEKIHLPNLEVPHPEMANRLFVLKPLQQIAPGLILPSGLRIQRRIAELETKNSDDLVSIISGIITPTSFDGVI